MELQNSNSHRQSACKGFSNRGMLQFKRRPVISGDGRTSGKIKRVPESRRVTFPANKILEVTNLGFPLEPDNMITLGLVCFPGGSGGVSPVEPEEPISSIQVFPD